jgi:uncharacterized Zn-binding protein involved in type VI secretion
MKRSAFSLVALLSFFVFLFSVLGGRCDELFFDNGNIGAVFNGPTSSTEFTLNTAIKLTLIGTYHWNDAHGAAPGLLGLRSSDGKSYGPWQAVGSPGMAGVPDAYWEVFPNILMPPGTYTVIDSAPETWSQNAGSSGKGMAWVRGVAGAIQLELTYPAGQSPKVFTKGWVFGAKCISIVSGSLKDISDKVQWSGTASFNPPTGAKSYPTFNGEGANTITLTCTDGTVSASNTFEVVTVNTAGYSRLGDKAQCPADAHGCPACPHPTVGPIRNGSSVVLIDGLPAARKGDFGGHAACCGPNTFVIAEGDTNVLIEGQPAAKIGSVTTHCGGTGRIIESSAGDLPRPNLPSETDLQASASKLADPALSASEKETIRQSLTATLNYVTALLKTMGASTDYRKSESTDPILRNYGDARRQMEIACRRLIAMIQAALDHQ